MRIMAVNPGSGALLRMALTPLVLPPAVGDDDPLPADPQRVEIIAYSDRLSYTEPVADLQALQRSVSSAEMRHAATHLTPLLGLAARDLARLTEDHEGHHVAVVQDLARADVTDPAVSVAGGQRSTAFRDLLTTLTAEPAGDGSGHVVSNAGAATARSQAAGSRHRRCAPRPPGSRRRPARAARHGACPDDPAGPRRPRAVGSGA